MTAEPHVLVIEDDPDNRALFERHLSALGLRVTSTDTGEEGVALALADPPEMVIVDVLLPGIDGREVIRRLREDFRTRRCTIVVSSVLDPQDVADIATDAVLPKPFRKASVQDIVADLRAGRYNVPQKEV